MTCKMYATPFLTDWATTNDEHLNSVLHAVMRWVFNNAEENGWRPVENPIHTELEIEKPVAITFRVVFTENVALVGLKIDPAIDNAIAIARGDMELLEGLNPETCLPN